MKLFQIHTTSFLVPVTWFFYLVSAHMALNDLNWIESQAIWIWTWKAEREERQQNRRSNVFLVKPLITSSNSTWSLRPLPAEEDRVEEEDPVEEEEEEEREAVWHHSSVASSDWFHAWNLCFTTDSDPRVYSAGICSFGISYVSL